MNQFGALVAIDPGTKLADAVVSFSGGRSRLSGGAAERTQLSSWLISWRPLPCFTFQAFSTWQLTDWTKRHSLRGYFCRYFRLLHCPTVLIRTVNQWRGGTRVIHELLIDDTSPQIDLLGAMQGLCSEDATGSALDDLVTLNRTRTVLTSINRVAMSCLPKRSAAWPKLA